MAAPLKPSTRARPTAADIAFVVLLAACASLEYTLENAFLEGAAAVLLIAAVLPVVLRSIAPVLTVGAMYGLYAAAVVVDPRADEALVPGLAPLVAVYALGLRPGWRPLAGALLASGVPAIVVAVTAGDPTAMAFVILLVLGALAVGRAVSALGFESEALEARAAELERERDDRAAAAVAEERARIARELHDVIGHSISVMGVQAGAVRRKLTPAQEREREALLAVERTGRDAVAEMRRLLGFLRAGDAGAPAGSLPTLGRIEDLVAEMRRAGLHIELQIDGVSEALSPGRELAAFRIVQEALTNVLKHSPGARVEVELREGPSGLELMVRDDGAGRVATFNGDGDKGHGLVGMRERVAMYGGTFVAGPVPGAGFEVRATLPAGGG